MLAQLQVQQPIRCSGHLCTPGRKQQEEEAHQEDLQIQGVAAPVNGVIKEALDQEEALGQEEQDHLHHPLHQEEEVQEEDQEQVRRQEELHPSRQEEEQVTYTSRHCTTSTLIRSMEST